MDSDNNSNYKNRFSSNMMNMFFKIWQINFRNGYSRFWIKTFRNQVKARKNRNEMAKKGVEVPPVMIFSITNRCNLRCEGCYASAQKRNINGELPAGRIRELFSEANELGTGIILLAGGEPLMRRDVLVEAAGRKDTVFPVFTNSLLLNNGNMDLFDDSRNLIPVLSIEGDRKRTDSLRGKGTYEKIMETASEMKKRKMFYGMSITIDRNNYEQVMSPDYINEYFKLGCRLFFFVEYVPSCNSDMDNCLSEDQKSRMSSRLTNLRIVFPSLFIALPGDEDKYGGCMAAGRGFIHISSTGDLEPCPFAPFSDINLSHTSLEKGLRSEFLSKIRSEHENLTESKGGCTLWENREWTESMLENTKNKKISLKKSQHISQIPA